MTKAFITGILVLMSTAALWAQSIQAMVMPERDSLVIGDPLPVKLIIQAPKGIQVQVPSIEAVMAGMAEKNPQGDYLELVEAQDLQSRQTSDFNVIEQQFTITAWNEGYYEFPKLAFVAQSNGQSDSFYSSPVVIRAKFPATVTSDSTYIADIKPVLEEPTYWSDYLPYVWMGLGALGIIVLVVLMVRFIRHRNNKPLLPPSPEEQALRQLEELQQARGDAQLYHAGISFVLRQYLNHRYELRALENSTEEIYLQLAALPASHPLVAYRNDIIEVLHTADLVKFAKASPLEAANSFAADTTTKIIGLYVEEKTERPS